MHIHCPATVVVAGLDFSFSSATSSRASCGSRWPATTKHKIVSRIVSGEQRDRGPDHDEPHRERGRESQLADEHLRDADEVHHPRGQLPGPELLHQRGERGELRCAEDEVRDAEQRREHRHDPVDSASGRKGGGHGSLLAPATCLVGTRPTYSPVCSTPDSGLRTHCSIRWNTAVGSRRRARGRSRREARAQAHLLLPRDLVRFTEFPLPFPLVGEARDAM